MEFSRQKAKSEGYLTFWVVEESEVTIHPQQCLVRHAAEWKGCSETNGKVLRISSKEVVVKGKEVSKAYNY